MVQLARRVASGEVSGVERKEARHMQNSLEASYFEPGGTENLPQLRGTAGRAHEVRHNSAFSTERERESVTKRNGGIGEIVEGQNQLRPGLEYAVQLA